MIMVVMVMAMGTTTTIASFDAGGAASSADVSSRRTALSFAPLALRLLGLSRVSQRVYCLGYEHSDRHERECGLNHDQHLGTSAQDRRVRGREGRRVVEGQK